MFHCLDISLVVKILVAQGITISLPADVAIDSSLMFFFVCFSYPDIVVYLLYTTSFVTLEEVKNYKSLQSFKYFTSGWVLEVEWKEYSKENIVLILGKVRHSYAASKTPLRPWVLVRSNGTILVAHCTCMAGLAETCSHVDIR